MSENASSNGNYETGYGRPPEKSRFEKGKSGNPKGRPRKSLSTDFGNLVDQALDASIIIREKDKSRKSSKREAMIIQLVNKAVSGDSRSIVLLLKIEKQKAEAVAKLKEPCPKCGVTPQDFTAESAERMSYLVDSYTEVFDFARAAGYDPEKSALREREASLEAAQARNHQRKK